MTKLFEEKSSRSRSLFKPRGVRGWYIVPNLPSTTLVVADAEQTEIFGVPRKRGILAGASDTWWTDVWFDFFNMHFTSDYGGLRIVEFALTINAGTVKAWTGPSRSFQYCTSALSMAASGHRAGCDRALSCHSEPGVEQCDIVGLRL